MASVTFGIARTGLEVAEQVIQTCSQNAANAKSIAYKEMMPEVTDLAYTQMKNAGVQESADTFERPIGIQRGSGARVTGITRIMTQGAQKTTNNPLDVMINGAGYIAITLPGGNTGYTRAGNFRINNTRQVVTPEGYALADNITIPDGIDAGNMTGISISSSGLITATDPTNPINIITIGQLNIYTFPNEQALQLQGGGILLETEASGPAQESIPGLNNTGTIIQGALEESNVSAVTAITDLIAAQRVYEMNTKFLMAEDERLKNTNNMYQS
ncbi:MAG: flagellar basal-body rod protein FlgG [Pseudomonadota bacterium]|jgi:flagellar basal-body rod protein FlgG